MQRLPLTVPLTVLPHYHTLGMTPNHGCDETCARTVSFSIFDRSRRE